MRVLICKPPTPSSFYSFASFSCPPLHASNVKESSIVAVQIFDQRKFKKRDQGFLGVVNIRVADVIDLELGGHGASCNVPLIR